MSMQAVAWRAVLRDVRRFSPFTNTLTCWGARFRKGANAWRHRTMGLLVWLLGRCL